MAGASDLTVAPFFEEPEMTYKCADYDLLYLASPYTHNNKEVVLWRYHEVCRIAGKLIASGIHVLSPIAHSHVIATGHDIKLPTDFEFWQQVNHNLLDRCDALLIAPIDGWMESKGVRDEIIYAKNKGIPRFIYRESDNRVIGL